MADKSQKRCLMCGRLFEVEAAAETTLGVAFPALVPGKSKSFCPLCEARLKKEAQDTQKDPKPM
ncbi:MAG: hypothetical protein ACOX6Z_08080 [Dethiobacteria bacterium]